MCKSYEIIKQFIEVESSSECKLVSEAYLGAKTKMILKCKCGEVFSVTWDNFYKNGKRQCDRNIDHSKLKKEESSRVTTHETFVDKVHRLVGSEYTVMGKYIKSDTKIKFKHNACGYTWNVKPSGFVNSGTRCPQCSHSGAKTHEEFLKDVYYCVGDEYKVVGKYKKSKEEIKMKHSICGSIFYVTPNDFNHEKKRCQKCKPSSRESKGEVRISEKLKKQNIDFERENVFSECRHKNPLPFDFYVKGKFLLEFDGRQHFTLSDFGGKGQTWAIERLLYTNTNDKIKNQYCIDNNISLIRIPYWEEKNIETILESALMHYNIIPKTDVYNHSFIAEWIVDSDWNHDEYLAKCPKNIKDLKQVS